MGHTPARSAGQCPGLTEAIRPELSRVQQVRDHTGEKALPVCGSFGWWSVQPLRDGKGPYTGMPVCSTWRADPQVPLASRTPSRRPLHWTQNLSPRCNILRAPVSFNHNSFPADRSKVGTGPDLTRSLRVVEDTLTFPSRRRRSGLQPLLEHLAETWQGAAFAVLQGVSRQEDAAV